MTISPSKPPRYKYTLGFIHCPETDSVLLLNRQKSPWMGRWNGVGGKLEEDESPLDCIIRETQEETNLVIDTYVARGVLKWFRDGKDLGGVYLFTGTVSKEQFDLYKTPWKNREGILDWKLMEWILHEDNVGVVDNIRILFKLIFSSKESNLFHAIYEGNVLTKCYPVSPI